MGQEQNICQKLFVLYATWKWLMAFAQLGAECVHLFLCFLRSAFNGGNFLTAILVIFMHISIQDSFRFFAIVKPQVTQADREETTKPSRDW